MTDYPDKKPSLEEQKVKRKKLYTKVPKDVTQAWLWQQRKSLMTNRAKLKAQEARWALVSTVCTHKWGMNGGSAFGAVSNADFWKPVHTCLICDKTFEVMRKP